MRNAAKEGFLALTTNLEGYTPFMYLDIKGLVTTAIGNLIDSGGKPGGAYSPFKMRWRRNSDNELASYDEIQGEWDQIKARQEHKLKGGFYYKQFGTLHLDEEAIYEIVDGVAASFENTLKSRYPDFENWCSDAQVATMLIAWAYGPGFSDGFKGLKGPISTYLKTGSFASAASCFPSSQLTSDRNAAIIRLFQNADVVTVNQLDPDFLYYPKDLVAGDDPTGGGGPIPKRGVPGGKGGSVGPNDAVQRNLQAQLDMINKQKTVTPQRSTFLSSLAIGFGLAGVGYLAYDKVEVFRKGVDSLVDRAKKVIT